MKFTKQPHIQKIEEEKRALEGKIEETQYQSLFEVAGENVYNMYKEGETVDGVYLPTVLDNYVSLCAYKNPKLFYVSEKLDTQEFMQQQNLIWARNVLKTNYSVKRAQQLLNVIDMFLNIEDLTNADKVAMVQHVQFAVMNDQISNKHYNLEVEEKAKLNNFYHGYSKSVKVYEKISKAVANGVKKFYELEKQSEKKEQDLQK